MILVEKIWNFCLFVFEQNRPRDNVWWSFTFLDYKNSDFNSAATISFLKGLTHEFGKKEKFPLCMFLSKIGQEIMFDDLFLENKPS